MSEATLPAKPETDVIEVEATTVESSKALTLVERTKPYIKKFDKNAQEVALAIKTLGAMTVSNAEERAKLYEMATSANKARLLVEGLRKEVVKPLNDLVKAINDYANNSLVDPLVAAVEKAKGLIQAFDALEAAAKRKEEERLEQERKDKEAKAKAEEKRIADEAEAEKERIRKEAFADKQKVIDAMPRGIARIAAQRALDLEISGKVAQVEADAAQATTEVQIDHSLSQAQLRNEQEDLAATKAKGGGKVWSWEVTDISKVPIAYLQVIPASVTNEVRKGTREIPGIRIFQKDSLALR